MVIYVGHKKTELLTILCLLNIVSGTKRCVYRLTVKIVIMVTFSVGTGSAVQLQETQIAERY